MMDDRRLMSILSDFKNEHETMESTVEIINKNEQAENKHLKSIINEIINECDCVIKYTAIRNQQVKFAEKIDKLCRGD